MIEFEQHQEGKPTHYLINEGIPRQNFLYTNEEDQKEDLKLYPNAEHGHVLDLKKGSFKIVDWKRIEGTVRVRKDG